MTSGSCYYMLEVTRYLTGQKLLEKLPSLLGGVDVKPCLLHGDLWSGNISSDKQGAPVILDPACYCELLPHSVPQ